MQKFLLFALTLTLIGCSGLKSGRMGELPHVVSPDEAATVTVIRPYAFTGSAIQEYILLNGKNIFSIAVGEYTQFKVNQGNHTIAVKCFDSWSQTWKVYRVNFSILPKTEKYFEIGITPFTGNCVEFNEISSEDGKKLITSNKFISPDTLAVNNPSILLMLLNPNQAIGPDTLAVDNTDIYDSDNLGNGRTNNSNLGLAGALITGAAVGAVSPGDTSQQITAGLQAASTVALREAQKNGQAYSSPLAQAGIQMAQTLNGTDPSYSAQARTAQMLANSLTNNNSGGTSVATSTCPTNFNHLSSEMPEFRDSKLREIRQDILATNLASIVAAAKQQGISKNQAVSMALRQADEFESTARINAKAGAEVSTELTTRGIVTAVKTGRLPLSIPCSGSASMVQAAQCNVILQIWGAMANREQAKYMETCW